MRRVAALSLLLAACGPDKSPDTAPTSDAASTSDTASTSDATTGGASDSSCPASTGEPTTGEPAPDSCEARLTKEECVTTANDCAWQTEFARWSEQCGCGDFTGPPRCLPVLYVGDGCLGTMCPSKMSIYYRDFGDGVVELMDAPASCGTIPIGWSQCHDDPEIDSPACKCFC